MYEFLNKKKHKVKKFGGTNRNDGLHSFLRKKLACLRRKQSYISDG